MEWDALCSFITDSDQFYFDHDDLLTPIIKDNWMQFQAIKIYLFSWMNWEPPNDQVNYQLSQAEKCKYFTEIIRKCTHGHTQFIFAFDKIFGITRYHHAIFM